MTDFVLSLIRTFVPIVVAVLTNFLGRFGFHLDDAFATTLSGVIALVYYAAVRKIEETHPDFGWLLGKPGAPTYPETPAPGRP